MIIRLTTLSIGSVAMALFLAACAVASPSTDDTATTSQDSALKKKKGGSGGCGPVRWEGQATAVDKGDAYSAAEAAARQTCVDTPSFCGVDCKGAPVVAANCVHYVVNDDPKIDEYYECTVTIEASGF
jgi:hypothetical protein